MMKGKKCGQLAPICFGVALGLTAGLCMLFFAWAAWLGNYWTASIQFWAISYPGYGATMMGGLIGFGWGFLKGFISGLLIALFYNLCRCCCCKGGCACCSNGTCSPNGKKS